MNDRYRLAASLLLLRPAGEGYELLLLHKPRKKDAWQLPQGGVENSETAEQCAVRELQEEAGITDVTILGKSPHVYKYDFPTSYRRFRPDDVCGQHIEFVFGTTSAGTQVQVDGKEVDRYEWITVDQLPKFLKRAEYLNLVQDLYDEAINALSR